MIEFAAPKLIAPDGSIVGVIEETLPGLYSLDVIDRTERLGPGDPIPIEPGNYLLDHALSQMDTVEKSRAVARLIGLRRRGATIVLLSHDEPLLESCADEIWWIREGVMVARGDPGEVLRDYRRHVAVALRRTGGDRFPRLSPTMRKGNGRAVLEQIEMFGEDGEPATVWRSGEEVAIRVNVRFESAVEDPVVGIMIRTRIGLNVYGTNTELEQLKPGPAGPGDRLRVTYRFRCDLCPGEYTITAASHDPDGVWHDWLEDAVAFSVTDSRYTAGVANLRAKVEFAIER
jgi:lipopolysaccharide transport system ATP-binding protein